MRPCRATTLLCRAIVGLLLAQPAMAELPRYQVQDLGTLGGQIAEPADINNSGEVTGFSATADGSIHAFLYIDGEMRDLGTLGGLASAGQALNDLGQVTGSADTPDSAGHAFLY